MRLISILAFIFLLTAFAIGTNLNQSDSFLINSALDNASITITNITLEKNVDVYTNGLLNILEKFIHFIGTAFVEVTRLGVFFGVENPDYFTTEFIIGIVKLIFWLIIISLLIRPLFYLGVVLIMLIIWIVDKLKNRKNAKNQNRGKNNLE